MWARRGSAAIALVAVSSAIATVGDEPNASAAAADCKRANCASADWVNQCKAAVTCAHIPPVNATLGDRVPSHLPLTLGGKAVPSVHRLPPQVQYQKKPGSVVTPGPAVLNTAKTPIPPNAAWQLAPGAPPLKTMDRRRVGPRASVSSDAMQDFGVTFSGMQAQWTLEDQKATQRSREDAAIVNRRPQWVGDPLKENYHVATSHSPVTSCDDYAYKKMFEQAWFRDAALALGSDYRGVWNIATRADSPVRLNRTLSSYGGSPIASSVDQDALVATNTFLEYQFAATPTAAHGWALATQLEQAHRLISGAEDEDIARRELRFNDILTQLFNTQLKLASLMCQDKNGDFSSGPDLDSFSCIIPPPGGGTPNKPGDDGKKHPRLKAPEAAFDARKSGRPLLTAALRKHPAFGVASPQSTAALRASRTRLLTRSIKGMNAALTAMGSPPAGTSAQPASPTTITGGGANVVGSSGRHTVDMSGCAGKTANDYKQCVLRAQIKAINADINDALAFEKSLGAAGCLHPDMIANHCNWSYQGFAEGVTMLTDWTPLAKSCKSRIGDFGALTDKAKQTALANAHTLFPSDVGKSYATSWSAVETWYAALNDAAAKWIQYDLARKVYLSNVAATTRLAAGMPRSSTGYGTSSGDGFDVGHAETFGGGAHYGFSWAITPMALGKPFYSADTSCGAKAQPGQPAPPGVPCGIEQRICRFNGTINATADAKASLFGFDVNILDAKITAYAEDNAKHSNKGGHLDAHFTLLGNELFSPEVKSGIDVSSTPSFQIARPVADVSASYPDPPLEMGFMVGPIPVTLQAGMSIGAGVDLSADGDVEDTCAAPGGTQPTFSLIATLSPHVQADAFGQAAVDLLVVDAGVRINLNLVQVGLPVAFGINVNGGSTTLDAHADLTLAALAGSVSIFAEVHYLVGSDDYELPIFSWNGISSSRSLLDETTTFPTDALSYLMHTPEPWHSL